MKRFTLFAMAALLGLSIVAADAGNSVVVNYNVPAGGKFVTDSLSFSKNGSPSRLDCLIGAADRDTTLGLIPLAGLESWSVLWIVTNAPGPATSSTWALNCTLQVSVDGTNWRDVTPGAGVWAQTTSTDANTYQILYVHDTADSAVGKANGPGLKEEIATNAYARFKLKVANSADDTVYVRALSARRYSKE
jgi:hypothetical protein